MGSGVALFDCDKVLGNSVPSGVVQRVENVEANQILTIAEENAPAKKTLSSPHDTR
jgi:hypothetical protein